uniref:Uncharacterized protein n=1 Tax=Caldilinea aerophila TaxID=133453 RepID=A0A7C1JFG0_9CHLR
MQIEKYDPPNKQFIGDLANYVQSLFRIFHHNLQSERYTMAGKLKKLLDQARDELRLQHSG